MADFISVAHHVAQAAVRRQGSQAGGSVSSTATLRVQERQQALHEREQALSELQREIYHERELYLLAREEEAIREHEAALREREFEALREREALCDELERTLRAEGVYVPPHRRASPDSDHPSSNRRDRHDSPDRPNRRDSPDRRDHPGDHHDDSGHRSPIAADIRARCLERCDTITAALYTELELQFAGMDLDAHRGQHGEPLSISSQQ